MSPTTPLLDPAAAPSEIDDPPFDESATRAPVELLIQEAKRRARRRRITIAAIVAATVAVAAIATTASLGGGAPPQGPATELGAAAGTTSFGVFEPLRGRIVYVAGVELRAVDPADPTSVHRMDLPDELWWKGPVAAGWSADGTRLALTSEGIGETYVMTADGRVAQARRLEGCCVFVSSPWLSPDGTSVVDLVTADRIHLRNLEEGDASRVIELEQPILDFTGFVPTHTWSPDGARIAFAVDRQVGTELVLSVAVVDVATGSARELDGLGFGHIRHMTWSPDGSRLLIAAGQWRYPTDPPVSNPFILPVEADLYLVAADDPAAAPHRIARGHYVAATWSPDGDQIAAIDFAPTGRKLIAMRADGSASQVLVSPLLSGLMTGLAWHPAPAGR